MAIPTKGLRLNLGCGRHVRDGFFNVDIAVSPLAARPPELLSDVKKIALPDGCAREIQAIHLWEHLYRWECDDVIVEWHRLLESGGLLVLEMPDLFKFCENILTARTHRGNPDQMGMWGLYGDPREKNPHMIHRWGWTPSTLRPFLEANGFEQIVVTPTEWHKAGREHRDFRMEAYKK